MEDFLNKQKALNLILEEAAKRNITQKKLCDGIVDHTHFNRIINNKRNITYEVIFACATKLGLSIDTLLKKCSVESNPNLTNIIDHIRFILLIQKYTELPKLYNEILNYKSDDNCYINQLLNWVKAIIETELNHNHLYAIDLLINSIRYTKPEFSLKNIDFYMVSSLKNLELDIFNTLAVTYKRANNYREAENLFYLIIKHLENTFIVDTHLLPKLYYNLTVTLGKQFKYKEIQEVALKAIEYCFKNNTYIQLGNLYFMLAVSYKMQGQVELGNNFFEKSYSFYQVQIDLKNI